MPQHPRQSFGPYLGGALSAAESAAVEQHLEACADCAAQVTALRSAPGELPDGLLHRIMSRVEGPERFAPVKGKLQQFYGWTDEELTVALEALGAVERWTEGPGPGTRTHPLETRKPGVALFVWIDRDTEYPFHDHPTDERVLVLQGAFQDSHGLLVRRGDEVLNPRGTSHSLTATGSMACLCAVLLSPPG